jgi:Protein of unknown function (DUF2914)
MTKTLRSLALLTSCLAWSACSEDSAPKSVVPAASVAPMKSAAQPELDKTPVEAPGAAPAQNSAALTATAPARPVSLADGPAPQKLPEVQVVDSFEIAHDEPELEKDKPSFDRPLQAAEVKVERFVLATGVEQREPTGETDVFDTGTGKIFAFVQLANESAPYAFEVHWEKIDGPKSRYGVKLEVPTASRFRTWAWTRIRRSPGEYRAVLRTPEGEEIASREFTIEAADVK